MTLVNIRGRSLYMDPQTGRPVHLRATDARILPHRCRPITLENPHDIPAALLKVFA
jgi:hypothetical protein